MAVEKLIPGTIVRANGGKDVFVVMPETFSMTGYLTVLQVQGERLKPGETILRTTGRMIGVLGNDWEVVEDLEFRMVARGGKITGCLLKRVCK